MRLKKIKTVAFCDLDGTLLDTEGKIKQGIFQYIDSLAEERYIVTGRSKVSLLSIEDYSRMTSIFCTPMICYNGNALWKTEERRLKIINGMEGTKIIAKRLMEHQIDFTVDIGDMVYAATRSSALKYALYNKIPRRFVKIGMEGISPKSSALLFHIYCSTENMSFVQDLFGEDEIRYEFWPAYLMVYPIHTDKVNGIRYLLEKHLDLRVKVITIGNGDNDIEMTRFADCGIAVSESTCRLKQAADIILEKSF